MKMHWLAGALLLAARVQAAEVSIDPDRMLVINGQRTFVLGMYENPTDDAVLKSVKDAGFNLVQAQPDAASLDRLQRHGLWAWVNTGGALDLSEDPAGKRAQLKTMAEGAGQHPALIVWEVPDEALWNNWYSAMQWRFEREPHLFRAELENRASDPGIEKIREKFARAQRLRNIGNYAESEPLMDECWELLGVPSKQAGFGLANAPERAAKMEAGMVEGYKFLRSLDPHHPVWMNHAPRNQIVQLAAYNKAADIAGCDIYPVGGPPWVSHSDLADQTNSSVGVYTDRMQEAAPGKPVWMVLQGFAWWNLEENPSEESILRKGYPTLDATRYMAFDTIVHGARGILYWGSYKVPKDGPFWKDLLSVASELNALQPVLSAPDTAHKLSTSHQETFGSIDRAPLVLGKDAPDGTWLLVVNENVHALPIIVDGLGALEGKTFADYYLPGETVTVSNGKAKVYVAAKSFVLLKP